MSKRFRQRFVAIALGLIAAAIAIGIFQETNPDWLPTPLAITALIIIAVLLIAILWSSFSKKRDFFNLDWFLPVLRKDRTGSKPPFVIRLLQTVFPRSWFANREKGRPGKFRKLLKRIGPSLLACPIRRVMQTVCLLTFASLFFYVCWPYHARPEPPGEVSSGWAFLELNQGAGFFDFSRDVQSTNESANWTPETKEVVYLVPDQNDAIAKANEAIACRVIRSRENRCTLEPPWNLDDKQFDRLLTFTGEWSIHENDPNAWPSHYTVNLARKEMIPAETFLAIDPLVSLSTAIASRSWVWSLMSAGIILLVCVLIPRGFCGYICPLGTIIDLFDWAIAGRVKKFRVPDDGWWVHTKYWLLSGILVCAMFGVLISGIFAAIPVVTRAFLFIGEPLQTATTRDLHQVAPMNAGHWLSIGLFAAILSLGFLRPRFWCKYVCPSGAVFSIGNLFRVTERKVESSCINCNKCVEICPFDAIKPDFTTRTTDCTLCQTCGGVCPTHAIKFVDRWNLVELKTENDPPTGETAIGRRGFISLAAGSAAAVAGGVTVAATTKAFGAKLESEDSLHLIRPPGSVPEEDFLQKCIRCGECFKACPNNVLQAEGFEQGLEGIWAPLVNADWAGCESSCNACGQVCPTGAIRALPLEEKKAARMGLAIVNEQTCLPLAGEEACQLCVDECNAAGYEAIEFTQAHTQVDESGQPILDSGFLAPVVIADKCVGCGLCQTRCHAINVKEKHLLDNSAIIVEAGPGKEDRISEGSYLELRESEQAEKEKTERPVVPKIDREIEEPNDPFSDEDPFGLE